MANALYSNHALRHPDRLRAVQHVGLSDDGPNSGILDGLVRAAADVLGAPVALITILDDTKQRFASHIGLAGDVAAAGTPVGESICQHIVATGEALIVYDTLTHPLTRNNPCALQNGWRSYAGVPVKSPGGDVLGAFCVADHRPRRWSERDTGVLRRMASIAEAELGNRSRQSLLERIRFAEVPAPMWIFDAESHRVIAVNDAALQKYEYGRDEFLTLRLEDLRPEEDVAKLKARLRRASSGFEHVGSARHRTRSGRLIDVDISTYEVMVGSRRCFAAMALDVTAQRRAQEEQQRAVQALRDSEQLFRALFENAAVGIAVGTSDGRLLACNPALQRMFGYTEDELRNRTVEDITHGDDRDEVRRTLKQLFSGSVERVEIEQRYICKCGAIKWARVVLSPVQQRTDGQTQFVAIVEDITQVKLLAEEGRQRESYFQSLIENASDVVTILDAHGTITYVSPPVERMLGYSSSELVGKPAVALIHPEDQAAVGDLLGRSGLEKGDVCSVSFRFLHKDGSWRCLDATGRNLLADPAVHGIVVNTRDTTAEWLVEKRLRHVTATSPAALFAMTLKDGVMIDVWVSESLKQLTGHDLAATRDLAWWVDNLHPDDRLSMEAAVRQLYTTGEMSHEHRFLCADGTYKWIRAQMRILSDAGGAPVEIVGSLADASEFRRLEAQLRQAQKMEAVGRLAGGIAHDFNNILTAINGHTELVLADLAEHDPMRVDLQEIRRSADRAAALTRQLLAFSRKQVLHPEVLDVAVVVRDMERMIRRVVSEDIQVVTNATEGENWVQADRGQLEQALLNLVVNARDAMAEHGTIHVEVRQATFTDPVSRDRELVPAGAYVSLSVQDSGSGIPPEILPQIFEPFFTTKEAGKGTGLGLSTVYGSVRQSGGYVWVDSAVGAGTTFTIQLPAVSAPTPSAESRPDATMPVARGAGTILVCEDERAVRQLTSRMLQKQGYRVIEAANGGEALLIARNTSVTVDLLLTDLVMPHMSGCELAAEIRTLHPEMHVLYMSGYSSDALPGGALAAGTPFLEKPFTLAELAQGVRETLSMSTPG